MAGEGRLFGRSEHYPIATRGAEFAKLLGNHGVNVRFGTEGSEVQILSPRPIPSFSSENPQKLAWLVTRFFVRMPVSEPSGRRFKPSLHLESLEISRRCCSRPVHPATFAKQSATLDATRRRGRTLVQDAKKLPIGHR